MVISNTKKPRKSKLGGLFPLDRVGPLLQIHHPKATTCGFWTFTEWAPYYELYKWSDMASPYKLRKKWAAGFFPPRNQTGKGPTLQEIFQFTCPSKPVEDRNTLVIDAFSESGNCHKMSEKNPGD